MPTLNLLIESSSMFHPEKKRISEGVITVDENTGHFENEILDYSQANNKMTQKMKGVLFTGREIVIRFLKIPYLDKSTNILYSFTKEGPEIKGAYTGNFLLSGEDFSFDMRLGLYIISPQKTITKSTKINGQDFPAKLTIF